MALPPGVVAGHIYRHDQFYKDEDGQWQPKFALVLAGTSGNDIIFRLLTSRANGRPQNPACYHGDPYPGHYLGYLGGQLTAQSWVDLRPHDDYDGDKFVEDKTSGALTFAQAIPQHVLCAVLDCAARADDTTAMQEREMRDQRAMLGCP